MSVIGMIKIASSSIGIADWFLLGCQISMAFLHSSALVCVASPAVACIYKLVVVLTLFGKRALSDCRFIHYLLVIFTVVAVSLFVVIIKPFA